MWWEGRVSIAHDAAALAAVVTVAVQLLVQK
jgi:hypothetical protein